MTISWMDPHTTAASSRSCKQCHCDTRALGLGQGSLLNVNGRWQFVPATSRGNTGTSPEPRLDAFVDINGKRLVHVSRKSLRPFNGRELRRILYAGQCIFCHRDFEDSVIKGWDLGSPPVPCKVFTGTGKKNPGAGYP